MPNLLWLCNHTHLIPDFHSNHAAIVYFPLQMWYDTTFVIVICDINDNNNSRSDYKDKTNNNTINENNVNKHNYTAMA